MSQTHSRSAQLTVRFPRVSGDEPNLAKHLYGLCWFSPRERG